MITKNWKVTCDDEVTYHRTRDEARKYAAKLNRHPANANIRQFGPYSNVDGIARVEKRVTKTYM